MDPIQVELPLFLHCENEPKTGDFLHDNRQFIYSPRYLSLIEIVPLNDYLIHYPHENINRTYHYTSKHYQVEEEFMFVFVQNNVRMVAEMNEIEFLQKGTEPMTELKLLDQAFEYYKKYLIWEDKQNL